MTMRYSWGTAALIGLLAGIPVAADAMPASTQPSKANVVAASTDSAIQQQINTYLNGLVNLGFARQGQGIWIQSGDQVLAQVQGTTPLPVASVTKAATTLAALETFGPDYQFLTALYANGPIENGVLQGDLVVQGSGDPFFVWEDAVAVGNALTQLGISRVTGNLLVVGRFHMNYVSDPVKAAALLKQGLNGSTWSAGAEVQFNSLPAGTPRPQVNLQGSVQAVKQLPLNQRLLVRHYSYPLAELLKKMNLWSNNVMAQMIADATGGAAVVSAKVAKALGVPPAEVQLVNGSGLGEANRMSPRASAGLFVAIGAYLQPYGLTLGDVFAVVGQDDGVLERRILPPLLVAKSGTLNSVSTLAGALPTQNQGIIWFSIINYGGDLVGFRTRQGMLLQSLQTLAGGIQALPPELTPTPQRATLRPRTELVN